MAGFLRRNITFEEASSRSPVTTFTLVPFVRRSAVALTRLTSPFVPFSFVHFCPFVCLARLSLRTIFLTLFHVISFRLSLSLSLCLSLISSFFFFFPFFFYVQKRFPRKKHSSRGKNFEIKVCETSSPALCRSSFLTLELVMPPPFVLSMARK